MPEPKTNPKTGLPEDVIIPEDADDEFYFDEEEELRNLRETDIAEADFGPDGEGWDGVDRDGQEDADADTQAEGDEGGEKEAEDEKPDEEGSAKGGDEGKEEEGKEGEKETEEKKPEGLSEEQLLEHKVSYRVNGVDVTKTVAEVVQDAQRAIGAEKRHQEAAELEKAALLTIDALKRDPLGAQFDILSQDLGEEMAYSVVERYAMDFAKRAMEFKKLPPEEQRRRKEEQTLQARLARLEGTQTQEQPPQQTNVGNAIARELIGAVEEAGYGRDLTVARAVALIYDQSNDSGVPMTMRQAVQRYNEGQRPQNGAGGHQSVDLTKLSAEDLERLRPDLAEAVAEKKRKERVEAYKKRKAGGKTAASTQQRAKPTGRKKHYTDYDQMARDTLR